MTTLDTLIRHATVYDGTGRPGEQLDVGVDTVGRLRLFRDHEPRPPARAEVDAVGLALAPGFIDVHTHDDTVVVRHPEMLPKISQGVTTVVVGNCGISASPVRLRASAPDPMNLLGPDSVFRYPRFADYRQAVEAALPAVNVAALVGHTALRSNHLDDLDRPAHPFEIEAMRRELADSLAAGALGLSTGLAYASAFAASTDELQRLVAEVAAHGALYTTHLRSEFEPILDALAEAFDVARHGPSPLIVSHLKCAGARNWGRSSEVLAAMEGAARLQPVGCDCYPYAASSSTLDLKQVTDEFDIFITWSTPHPEMAGQTLALIAQTWQTSLLEAARRLQPAGAVYHGMSEGDVQRILAHPMSMVGSDGLPDDPHPHPRLWGAFPRVLGHYARERGLLSLPEALRKMTGLSAARYGLVQRGRIESGYWADLVLFNPLTVRDTATFDDPHQRAAGIEAVWVNGVLSYCQGHSTGTRAGRFLPRSPDLPARFVAAPQRLEASS
ncbi:MAG: D-aminoacylase [Curvibacter sp.]|nr:MAG: D-aminoacylase [Curvibacter sp.]